jgi:hypothetical protein
VEVRAGSGAEGSGALAAAVVIASIREESVRISARDADRAASKWLREFSIAFASRRSRMAYTTLKTLLQARTASSKM